MKKPVMLSICGAQSYEGSEPDRVELLTEGELEALEDGSWRIRYEESELTGLRGTQTTFHLEPGRITLRRDGPLVSEMVFEEGTRHDSLYRIPEGALCISVCARRVQYDLSEDGGEIRVLYSIRVENDLAGSVEYRITVTPKTDSEG